MWPLFIKAFIKNINFLKLDGCCSVAAKLQHLTASQTTDSGIPFEYVWTFPSCRLSSPMSKVQHLPRGNVNISCGTANCKMLSMYDGIYPWGGIVSCSAFYHLREVVISFYSFHSIFDPLLWTMISTYWPLVKEQFWVGQVVKILNVKIRNFLNISSSPKHRDGVQRLSGELETRGEVIYFPTGSNVTLCPVWH